MATTTSEDETPRKENTSNRLGAMSSPDFSLPSAAETSYASSPEDEAKVLPVRRTLFKMEDEEETQYKKVMTLAESTKVKPSPSKESPSKYETILVFKKGSVLSESSSILAAASTTSSDTTAIPSWNLSEKERDEAAELDETMKRFVLSPETPDSIRSPPSTLGWKQRYHTLKGNFLQSRLSKDPGLVFEEARPFYAKKETADDTSPNVQGNDIPRTPVMEEIPPEPPASCSSALNLTPAQLAEIFLAFGQTVRERSPGSEHGDAASGAAVAPPHRSEHRKHIGDDSGSASSPSISPNRDETRKDASASHSPSTRFIIRENAAFKKIVEQDANSILTLQRALETQKQLCALKEVEIMDRHKELQISEDRIALLKKEREERIERETELVETIRILKLEIDKMTLGTGALFDKNKIADMESEIISQQSRISELETSLNEKEKQSFDLQTEIDYLRNQEKEEKKDRGLLSDEEIEALQDEAGLLAKDDIAETTLSVVDALGSISKRLELLEKEKEEKDAKDDLLLEQMRDIQSLLKLETEKKDMVLKVKNNPDEIEAIPLPEQAKGKTSNASPYMCGCCDWGVIVED